LQTNDANDADDACNANDADDEFLLPNAYDELQYVYANDESVHDELSTQRFSVYLQPAKQCSVAAGCIE